MKIAVTGGSGKAGRAVVRDLLEHGHDVLNVDRVGVRRVVVARLARAVPARGPHRLRRDARGAERRRGAARDRGRRAPRGDPLAGPRDARRRLPHEHHEHAHRLRRRGPARSERVVWASSETTLGLPFDTPPDYAPVDESHPLRPESSYALSKVLGEEMARQFSRWSGIPFVGLRFSNVMERADYERFPSYWDDPHLRKWNLWGYVDESHVAQSVRLALRSDSRRRHVHHRRRRHRHAAAEPRADGRGFPGVPVADASRAPTRCSGSTRLGACSATSPRSAGASSSDGADAAWRERPARLTASASA